MAKSIVAWSLGVIALAASMTWAGSAVPASPAKATQAAPAKAVKPKSAPAPQAGKGDLAFPGNFAGTAAPESDASPAAPKPILADAFIAQTILRVYLNHPAAIFVYNSRGQQVYHLDSQRAVEAVPLQGISTGFVYLTVRTAQGEMTKKLVFTGK